jgi:hypothetical protein
VIARSGKAEHGLRQVIIKSLMNPMALTTRHKILQLYSQENISLLSCKTRWASIRNCISLLWLIAMRQMSCTTANSRDPNVQDEKDGTTCQ